MNLLRVTAALGRNAIVKYTIYQSCTLPHSFINQISLQSLTTSPSEKLIHKGEVQSYLPSPTMHALNLLWISDAFIPGRKQQNLALSLGDAQIAFNIQKSLIIQAIWNTSASIVNKISKVITSGLF